MWQLAAQAQVKNPAAYINPFIGASTSVGKAGIYHGLGKTFPGATTPYGMVRTIVMNMKASKALPSRK